MSSTDTDTTGLAAVVARTWRSALRRATIPTQRTATTVDSLAIHAARAVVLLSLIAQVEDLIGVLVNFANPFVNPGHVAGWVVEHNQISVILGTIEREASGHAARPAALDALRLVH
jgi:hypothetical protein